MGICGVSRYDRVPKSCEVVLFSRRCWWNTFTSYMSMMLRHSRRRWLSIAWMAQWIENGFALVFSAGSGRVMTLHTTCHCFELMNSSQRRARSSNICIVKSTIELNHCNLLFSFFRWCSIWHSLFRIETNPIGITYPYGARCTGPRERRK